MNDHMIFKRKRQVAATPESAAKYASRWNSAIAAGQIVAAGVFGNIGFAGEAAHNLADSLSFDAKGRALSAERLRALKLRKLASGVLIAGGLVGIAGGSYQLAADKHEDSSLLAIGIAGAAAVINGAVAKRTHGVEHAPTGELCASGAHHDSRIHTTTDLLTGAIYASGLVLEARFAGFASGAVVLNGVIGVSAGLVTTNRIRHDATAI